MRGDLKQLPPVIAAPIFSQTRQSIGMNAMLWQSLDYFPLIRVMRQKDIIFSSVLTKIGNGDHLTMEEKAMIESRFRTHQWCTSNLPNKVVRLFLENADVDQYNRDVIPDLESTEHAIAYDTYKGFRTEKERKDAVGNVHRLHYRDTGYLPYDLKLTIGYPYMLTTNVDVQDLLNNGQIGTLQYIEHCPTSQDSLDAKRLWIKFENDHIGKLARLKARSQVRGKPEIQCDIWVPIKLRSFNIKVLSTITCHRVQFPLTPACAITVHKSQGGTFNEIVHDYQEKHKQQLVYVALSRVISLEGLYLTNASNDFTFHHARKPISPTTRSVRQEYERLEKHHLSTITSDLKYFLDSASGDDMSLIIANINVQSLAAHSEDISSDSILTRAMILCLTETWVHPGAPPIAIEGYRLEHQKTCEKRSGGVAVYKRNDAVFSIRSWSTTEPLHQMTTNAGLPTQVADFCTSEIIMSNGKNFLLMTIYVHQQVSYRDLKDFLRRTLRHHEKSSTGRHTTDPIVLLGDFNISESNRPKLQKFLLKHYSLKLQNDPEEHTTLGHSCIDLSFSRYIDTHCKRYVSYFSYHRPILNKLTLADIQINNEAHTD